MMRSGRTLLAVLLLTLTGASLPVNLASAEGTLYVALDGDDRSDGTSAKPFATIQRAQTAVRQKIEAGLKDDTVVYLRGGTYFLEETLRFGPLDGGTAEHSVTWTAAEGETVTLSGGRAIQGWQREEGNMWSVGLDDWNFRQLYADGERLPRGRYPEEGFLKIESVSEDYRTLRFTEPLPERDFGGRDTEVVVVQNWSISRELITRTEGKELTAVTPIGWVGHMACLPKPRMSAFLENDLALVTRPGQWHLDRAASRLHYLATDGEDPNRRRFVAPRIGQLIDVEGTAEAPVRNLHFRRISFEHTGWLLPEIGYGGIQGCYHGTHVDEPACFAVDVAVELDYCEGCTVESCRLAHLGGSGIGIGAGCRDNRIVGCAISDIGGTGVNVGHMKTKDPLWADWSNPGDVPTGNEITNCYIHHVGADHWGAHGIFDAMTRDTRIAHNEVAWIPYGGIATGYVWNTERTSQQGCVIEYNHVHEVLLKLNDSGCLYTLGFQPGSIIRGNLLHGVRFGGFAGGQVCNNGIFFDQGSKGFLIEGNIIYDVDQQRGAKNTAVRFNQSSHDWQIWIDNTIQTDAATPEATKALAEKAGLEPEYRHLLNDAD